VIVETRCRHRNIETGPRDSGDPITIQLSSLGSVQADFDNVRLSTNVTAAVPEPETYALILVGLMLVSTARRRRG
jgi:hypothetical protein